MFNGFRMSRESIMSGTFNYGISSLGLSCLCLLFAGHVFGEDCDKSKCPGPLMYYKDVNCTPIYEKEGDCCASRYDCTHLNGRSADKCYVKNSVYSVGEQLKDEDRTDPCDISCQCNQNQNGVAEFVCAEVDCFEEPMEGCYLKHSNDACCDKVVCPKSTEEVFKCEVEGRTYMDGESFYPQGNTLKCTCLQGYKGENVAPFCEDIKCGAELHHGHHIRDNCIPVYYNGQSPITDCSAFFACQNNNETVIHSKNEQSTVRKSSETSNIDSCKFGNVSLHIGDELKQSDSISTCVSCVCEVPPVPTCRRIC